MKVLHAIETLDPRSGGTSMAFLSLLSALVRHGEMDVVAMAPAHPEAEFPGHLRETIRATGPAGQFRPGDLYARAAEHLRTNPPAIVHLHGLWSQDLVRIARDARRAAVATLWQPHGMLVRSAIAQKALKKQVFLRFGLRDEIAAASSIVFCTEGERELSVRPGRAPTARTDVAPLPVEPPWSEAELPEARRRAREALRIAPDERIVLFMGRLHPVKRVDLTLRAFAGAARRHEGARLLVAGSGDEGLEQSLRTLAADLEIDEQITWLGWIAADDRWNVLAAADVLILNSMFENFGFVLLEALSVGTRVVLSDNLAIAGELRATDFADVRPAEANALGEGLAAGLQKMGGPPQGPAWVRSRASPAMVAAALRAVYEQVAQPPAAAS